MVNKLFEKQIQQTISNAINENLSIISLNPVSGGDINQAYCLESKSKKYFLKINHEKYYAMFCTEAEALQIIATTDSIRVPKVICMGKFSQQSFLVLEFIELTSHGDLALFARQLAKLHLNINAKFGFENDNFIGTTPQKNAWTNNWIEFFNRERISFQLECLKKKNLNRKIVKKIERLLKQLPAFFSGYLPVPALLHGDLWQGNYAFDTFGNPVIYDPASYYGDHETDLAMLELFGHPGADFFQQYAQIFPVDSGYFHRKPLYNLYHIMNHANLFGGSYLQQLDDRVNELLKFTGN